LKVKLPYLLSGCLIILFLSLTACSAKDSQEAEPALTDAEIEALKAELAEKGGCSVETLGAAEAIVRFPVATPGYVPEGFNRQERIMISQLGAGLPEEMKHGEPVNIVNVFYFFQEDETVMFSTQQSRGKAGIGGSEPAEVCGIQGEKKYLPADPRRIYPSEILTLAIQKDGYSFSMYATLAGPLDEEKIEKILCSMEFE
jgi:hypothetical protein